jgi:hypothetical protein
LLYINCVCHYFAYLLISFYVQKCRMLVTVFQWIHLFENAEKMISNYYGEKKNVFIQKQIYDLQNIFFESYKQRCMVF